MTRHVVIVLDIPDDYTGLDSAKALCDAASGCQVLPQRCHICGYSHNLHFTSTTMKFRCFDRDDCRDRYRDQS